MRSTFSPFSFNTLRVPSVAMTLKPKSIKSLTTGTTKVLSRSLIETNTVPDRGNSSPAPNSALAKARPKSLSIPITSPVERISGPRIVSVPGNFLNGNTASLTAMWLSLGSSVKPKDSKVSPAITKEASFANGTPVALETNGTVREARGLASKM